MTKDERQLNEESLVDYSLRVFDEKGGAVFSVRNGTVPYGEIKHLLLFTLQHHKVA